MSNSKNIEEFLNGLFLLLELDLDDTTLEESQALLKRFRNQLRELLGFEKRVSQRFVIIDQREYDQLWQHVQNFGKSKNVPDKLLNVESALNNITVQVRQMQAQINQLTNATNAITRLQSQIAQLQNYSSHLQELQRKVQNLEIGLDQAGIEIREAKAEANRAKANIDSVLTRDLRMQIGSSITADAQHQNLIEDYGKLKQDILRLSEDFLANTYGISDRHTRRFIRAKVCSILSNQLLDKKKLDVDANGVLDELYSSLQQVMLQYHLQLRNDTQPFENSILISELLTKSINLIKGMQNAIPVANFYFTQPGEQFDPQKHEVTVPNCTHAGEVAFTIYPAYVKGEEILFAIKADVFTQIESSIN